MIPLVEARGLRKTFGKVVAIDDLDLELSAGSITGILGPNGAGKSTLLRAVLGLIRAEGSLTVLGRDPRRSRAELMRDVAYVPDVAILPRGLRVSQLMEYMHAVHPRFQRSRAEELLRDVDIRPRHQVSELSKGMSAQLHLALILSIDAKLLVLDEPTLALDVMFRKRFYDTLLTEFLDASRAVLIATHDIEGVEHILTHLMILDQGRAVVQCTLEEYAELFSQVRVRRDRVAQARSLGPLYERGGPVDTTFIFAGTSKDELSALGDPGTPLLTELLPAISSRAWSREEAST